MEINPQIFSNKGIVLDNIPMTIVDPQNKLRYINISHVNELLANSIENNKKAENSNSIQNNKKTENSNTIENGNTNSKQVGGNNTSSSSISSSSSSIFNKNSSNSISNSQSLNEANFSISPFEKRNGKMKPKQNQLFENRNIFLNQNNKNIVNLKKKIQKANKEFGLNNIISNGNGNGNGIVNRNQLNKKNALNGEKNIKNNSNIQFLVNNNLQQFLNQIPNKNIGVKKEGVEEGKKENQNKKTVSKKVQFQVRNYQTPSTFCGKNESCKMSKSDLCKAITEHFIVRGNIIASILSTLPRKTSAGFEGGYCYQRFLNLDKCQVCLPHNYNELMSMDTKSRIQTMMLFINYMTEKECNENKGLFRKLSLGEKKSLLLHGREGNDFNLLYTEYTNNVRVKYIQHLNILLEILNTLATMEGINNEELNALSLKTKETIDSMYHLCQFYYLYAIIALLNANITPIKREENNEKNKIKSNMKQFLATV